MAHLFKCGERITTKKIGPINEFLMGPGRFFWVTVKPGMQAMYQLETLVTRRGFGGGTKFFLVKLFGAEKMPESLIIDGAQPLLCEVEIVGYNLKNFIGRHEADQASKPIEQVELNVECLLYIM